jgi:transposase
MTAEQQYAVMRERLDERQWRIFLGTEALKEGKGGISRVARLSKSDRKTVRKGIGELRESPPPSGRIRRGGGGRKKLTETDATLVSDLEELIESKGDPMSLVRWTTKSLANLTAALAEKKHRIKKSALAKVLAAQGFSLKANKKNIEGVSHPDRDLQFRHIKNTCAAFERRGDPIISVDCKKKELIGNFKNHGQEWHGKGANTVVNVYEFLNLGDGKAAPYGVYDTLRNTGF